VNAPSTLLYGPAGWHYDDWKGIVYPRPQPRGFHPLPYLARYVNLVEINATFYAPVPARTSENWVRLLERADQPDFRFVVKIWGQMTHEPAFPAAAEVARWREVLAPLMGSGRLVALLAQFPWSVRDTPDARGRVLEIRDSMPATIPVATEFRHASWMRPGPVAWLASERLPFVNIDQPPGRDSLPPTALVTGPLAYARLHGRNAAAWFSKDAGRNERYDWRYSQAELDPWVERIEALSEDVSTTVVVANNHFEGKAMAAVLELAHKLAGGPVLVPESMLGAYPDLVDIRRPEPGELF